MTSKTGIRVGRPFLVTTMLLRSPCRTRVRRLTLPFGRPFGLPEKPGLNCAWRLLVADLVGRIRGRIVSPIRFVLVTRIRHSYSPAATWL